MDTHQEPAIRHLSYDQLIASTADHECPGVGRDHVCVKIAAVADLPTKFGNFHIVGFCHPAIMSAQRSMSLFV